MYPMFAVLAQLDTELKQAMRELSWRRNETTKKVLEGMRSELVWLRNYAHLIVDLDMNAGQTPDELQDFLAWLKDPKDPAPALSGQAAATRARIVTMLAERP
jgi:hypothetical protein